MRYIRSGAQIIRSSRRRLRHEHASKQASQAAAVGFEELKEVVILTKYVEFKDGFDEDAKKLPLHTIMLAYFHWRWLVGIMSALS